MSRLSEVHAKVDAFFERVEARYPDDIQCRTGCSDCCHVQLTITRVEADAIRDEVARWSPEQRRALGERGPLDHCAALDSDGRCRIYAARPVVCRSHGVPIRMRERGLPVIQACHRNFVTSAPGGHTGLAPDCVLDQETLSALVLAVDRAAGPSGERARIDLAGYLAELARA